MLIEKTDDRKPIPPVELRQAAKGVGRYNVSGQEKEWFQCLPGCPQCLVVLAVGAPESLA